MKATMKDVVVRRDLGIPLMDSLWWSQRTRGLDIHLGRDSGERYMMTMMVSD